MFTIQLDMLKISEKLPADPKSASAWDGWGDWLRSNWVLAVRRGKECKVGRCSEKLAFTFWDPPLSLSASFVPRAAHGTHYSPSLLALCPGGQPVQTSPSALLTWFPGCVELDFLIRGTRKRLEANGRLASYMCYVTPVCWLLWVALRPFGKEPRCQQRGFPTQLCSVLEVTGVSGRLCKH